MFNQAPDLPLYLERIRKNYYKGTTYKSWSNVVSLIREGYKVVTNDGGYGIVTEVDNLYIYISTTTDFPSLTYASGSWSLYVPTVSDISRFIPEPIDQTKLIPEILEVFQGDINEVDDSVLRLNYSKDYNKLPNELLNQTLSDLGITTYEELTTETLRRLIQESVPYYLACGRLLALDYIGLSLNVDLRYEQLWTSDYKVFYPKNEIPLDDLNNSYPTNYVRIYYDNLGTDIHENTIRAMFYQLAWICNVIYDIIYAEALPTAQEYSNIGELTNYIINFKSADANMQSALDEVYRDVLMMPNTIRITA